MKAVGYLTPQAIEHSDSLINIDIAKPDARGRDLLIKVRAVSVNPVDIKIRLSASADNNQHKVLGWDAVGEVVAVGEDVEYYNLGDQVYYAGDLTRSGSNAEYQLVDERIAGNKPKTLSDSEAAALPLTAITAWELLFTRLDFTPLLVDQRDKSDTALKSASENSDDIPSRILIVGAAGGVGSILTQLAATLTNAVVIGTASRPESERWVKELGADYVINHHQPLQPQLSKLSIDDITHVISLNRTGDHYDQLVEIIAPQGKLALIDDPQNGLDIMKLKRKSISLHWEFMFTRAMFKTQDMYKQRELLNSLADLIDRDLIKTTLGEHYGSINAENLKRAHAHIESNAAIGKIVLEGF